MARGRRLDSLGRPVKRGEIWFVHTERGGDRPVLILTRDPVASCLNAVVAAQLTSRVRGLVSELSLTPERDGVPSPCVVSFDNVVTIPRESLRRYVTTLSDAAMAHACIALNAALGCDH